MTQQQQVALNKYQPRAICTALRRNKWGACVFDEGNVPEEEHAMLRFAKSIIYAAPWRVISSAVIYITVAYNQLVCGVCNEKTGEIYSARKIQIGNFNPLYTYNEADVNYIAAAIQKTMEK